MKISAKLTAIIFAAIAAFASVSCEKSESSIKPEEILGSFTYNGNTYNIRSVVVYTLDNGQTEIWISETAGYTTVEQIEASVGELVINMRTAKIEIEEEQSENNPKDNLWIKYEGNINDGKHTIKCSLNKNNTTISLDFLSYNSDFTNKIEGSYNGPYTDYSVPDLNNQWAYNRQAKDIVSADYFEMEDGAPSRLVVYDKDGKAVELTIPKNNVGNLITIKNEDKNKNIVAAYDNGEEFEIYSGQVQIITAEENSKDLKVHIKLLNAAGKTLRADYQGAYRHRYGNKTNRAIFDSGYDDEYNGKFELTEVNADEASNILTFRFTPGNNLSGGQTDKIQAPILKVSREIVNNGENALNKNAFEWEFKYHTFIVASYDASTPDKPTANEGSVIEINCDENGKYTINLEVSTMIKKPVTQNKVDENGNIIYKDVPEKDDFGNIKTDSDGEVIYKKVPETEQVEVEIPASMDLFYTQAN